MKFSLCFYSIAFHNVSREIKSCQMSKIETNFVINTSMNFYCSMYSLSQNFMYKFHGRGGQRTSLRTKENSLLTWAIIQSVSRQGKRNIYIDLLTVYANENTLLICFRVVHFFSKTCRKKSWKCSIFPLNMLMYNYHIKFCIPWTK